MADLLVVGGVMIESVLRQLPAWALLYVPLCYFSCNTMRFVDAPFYSFTEVRLYNHIVYSR